MKVNAKILIVAFISCVYSCSSQGDGSVTVVDVNGDKMFVTSYNDIKPDTATILLSSLVENCALTQLETNDEAFFRPWFTTITEKYIGVRNDQSQPYKLFDRSGSFLCNVGASGQGPGEYAISPYDDIIDDKNELVYIAPFMGDKILVYNTKGEFLKNIVTPQPLNKAKIFLSDNILTVIHMPFRETKAMMYQFNANTGQLLNELSAPEHFVVYDFDGEIFSTRNVSGVFDFVHTNNDMLYHFDMNNNRIVPVFTMTSSHEDTWNNYLQINKDMILTTVNIFKNNRFVPKGLVASDLKDMTSSHINIVNDFYGNMPVQASVVTFRNRYFVLNIQPEQLIVDIENRFPKAVVPKAISRNFENCFQD